jgi:DGQHR domain-containing protein
MSTTFTSARDMDSCKNFCDQVIFKNKKAQATLEYMTLKIGLEPNSSAEICSEFWISFLSVMAGSFQSKEVDDLKGDYPWGCWQLGDTTAMENTPTLWEGSVSRYDNGAYQVHSYNVPLVPTDPPTSNLGDNFDEKGRIVWDLLIAKQQGRDVLVGAVTVGEIDAVCMVPHLPNFATNNDGSMLLAEWSLDPKKGLSQWQRRPDPKRIKSISNFMDSSEDNLIINSIMLYIPEGAPGVELQKNGKFVRVIIDPKEFLVPNGDQLTDVSLNKEGEGKDEIIKFTDHRPIWIVDGQHRTRGMALSNRGTRLDVPVVITHGAGEDTIKLEEVAKIFTEINTLANPLDNKQQHYLSHKFSIVAAQKEKTYGLPEDALNEKDRQDRLANIRMYKLASLLTMNKGGPFENGVQLVKGTGSAIMSRITLEEFTKQMRPLFISGIYSDPSLTIEEIHEDFSAYLSAWSSTANHHTGTWSHMPNKLRWQPNRSNSSELEASQPIVWIIFKTFPFIRNVANTRGMELNEDTYTEILAPVRGIDWYSPVLGKRFYKQYRAASEYMSIWIKQAIMNDEIRTSKQVRSVKIDEVHHGTALYAKPSEPVITSNSGATGTSITLTWRHGNIFKKPDECYIQIGQSISTRYILEDVEFIFLIPDGLSEEPSVATYTMNIENSLLENDDWEIIVSLQGLKPTRDLTITPNSLGELSND